MSCCKVCWDDISEPVCWSDGNREAITLTEYCRTCVKQELNTHFARWEQQVREADCEAALRRLLARPPPMTFADVCRGDGAVEAGGDGADGGAEVAMPAPTPPFLVCGDERVSSRLVGAPKTIQERDELWQQLKKFRSERAHV